MPEQPTKQQLMTAIETLDGCFERLDAIYTTYFSDYYGVWEGDEGELVIGGEEYVDFILGEHWGLITLFDPNMGILVGGVADVADALLEAWPSLDAVMDRHNNSE